MLLADHHVVVHAALQSIFIDAQITNIDEFLSAVGTLLAAAVDVFEADDAVLASLGPARPTRPMTLRTRRSTVIIVES